MITPGQLIQFTKLIKGIIVPWLRQGDDEYTNGWNDCVKETRRKYTKVIKPWLKTLENSIGE